MAQMREQEIAVRLDRRQLDFIFDNKVQNVAVPIEIGSPDFLRYPIDALPCLVTELRLVPGAGRETRDAESMPVTSFGVRISLMRANRRQGPSNPRGQRSMILTLVIRSSFSPNAVPRPLWPPPTISTSRTGMPSRERGTVQARGG